MKSRSTVQLFLLFFVCFHCLCGPNFLGVHASNVDIKERKTVQRNNVRNELMEATFVANVERVSELLQLDPDVLSSRPPVLVDRIEEDHGRTSLMVCGFDPQDTNGTKVDSDCATIARLLHQRGANLSATDVNGWDALALGAVRGYWRYCKFLLKHNVSANHVDHEQRSALMKAAAHGHFAVSRTLKTFGADFTLQDTQGLTALHYATKLALANASYIPFLEKFATLHLPLDIDVLRDAHNRTALMYAAINDNLPVTQTLLKAGADARLQDEFYVSTAFMPSDANLRKLLLEAAVNRTEAEHQAWLDAEIAWDQEEL